MSSLWTPPSRPLSRDVLKDTGQSALRSLVPWLSRRGDTSPTRFRVINPNNGPHDGQRYEYLNARKFADNEIRTTKYSVVSFLPKNLFEQVFLLLPQQTFSFIERPISTLSS